MDNRFVCIHGHFYQPPRENAWLEAIEVQPSAHPYHDWNERVTAECYAPNAASQILDSEGYITNVVNNYSRISFDFGPTLLSWLEREKPQVYRAVLDADRESRQRFSGHGSAIAHAYNHVILPLASERDKTTQVVWGIRDFQHRFGRAPEGMWLPETAVDTGTLDIMARHGIRFTILAPRQALRVRRKGAAQWWNVSSGRVDTTIPYDVTLPSGRSIAVFFYHGPVAHGVAFLGLLQSGEEFARRLTDALPAAPTRPQLAHVATDGESYGHHHRFGDMALAYALRTIESRGLAKLTNYGEFLERFPPTHEAAIQENSSWSCEHGVERWRADCGCADHRHQGWNQAWRAPLRQALDWLRDEVAPGFEKAAGELFQDPWQARDDYISVVLDRTPRNVSRFIASRAVHTLDAAERVKGIKLMELQRHAMLMYTSCGWFFEDIGRIESVQVMQYAGRVAKLADDLLGQGTEERLLEMLAKAESNDASYGNGRQIYETFVRPAAVGPERVAAHYAASSLFENAGQALSCCYETTVKDVQKLKCGRADVNTGAISVRSVVTGETLDAGFVAARRDDSTIMAAVSPHRPKPFTDVRDGLAAACAADDMPRIEMLLGASFPGTVFGSEALLMDMRYRVIELVLEEKLCHLTHDLFPALQSFYAPTPMSDDMANPPVETVRPLVQLLLNLDLRSQFEAGQLDRNVVLAAVESARLWNVDLDTEHLAYLLGNIIAGKMAVLAATPEDADLLRTVDGLVSLARGLSFPTNLHPAQTVYWRLIRGVFPDIQKRAAAGDASAASWVETFTRLGERLSIRIVA